MTITFKGGAVFARRTAKVDGLKKESWGFSKTTTTILLDPSTNLVRDVVTITHDLGFGGSRTIKGQDIKNDPECKRLGIGWYK